jgi:hypothetical protein
LVAVKVTSTEDLPEMFTSWLPNPTEEITKVVAEEGTEILKEPSVPVWVPVFDPFTTTEAPTNADPSLESFTVPEMVLFWACEEITNAQAAKPMRMGLTSFEKFINGSLLVIKRVQNTHFYFKKNFLLKFFV